MILRTHQALLCFALTGLLSNSCTTLFRSENQAAVPATAAKNDDKLSTDTALVPKRESKELHQMIAEVDSEVSEFGKEVEAESEETTVSAETKPAPSPSNQANSPQNRDPEFPLEINESVERWIEYFTVKDRERFQRFLERGAQYQSGIQATLEELDVPGELYFLAMIESGFVIRATSHVGAGGIWQFMPATGRRYGLKVDRYVDERRDVLRATQAAALYLKDLHNVFQSWYLAMAAYNAGEMRILGAIMRSGSRDFWTLVKKKALPKETMEYIPKFLAAAIIGHNPQRFGFTVPKPADFIDATLVAVPSPIRLESVAQATGLQANELRELNTHLSKGVTPPNQRDYEIWVPSEHVNQVRNKISDLHGSRLGRNVALADVREDGVREADVARDVPTSIKVKRGDTLKKIAKRYHKSVAYLKRLNNLTSSRLRPGTELKLSGAPVVVMAASNSTIRYRVRRGDNLDKIARRFGMSIEELKVANDLRRSRIRIGQLLNVRKRDAG